MLANKMREISINNFDGELWNEMIEECKNLILRCAKDSRRDCEYSNEDIRNKVYFQELATYLRNEGFDVDFITTHYICDKYSLRIKW